MTLGINLSFFITIHRCHGQCEGTSQRPMVVQRLIFKAQMISLKKPWISHGGLEQAVGLPEGQRGVILVMSTRINKPWFMTIRGVFPQ